MQFGDAEAVKRAVLAYKQKYHFSRPDVMRIDLIRQINGAWQFFLDKNASGIYDSSYRQCVKSTGKGDEKEEYV